MGEGAKKKKTEYEILKGVCQERATELYGEEFPEIVEKRLEQELSFIHEQNTAGEYLAARELSLAAREKTIPLCFRGAFTGSLVSFLSEIAYINPLPAHYYCPDCGVTEFPKDMPSSISCGSDLVDKYCPACGKLLKKDGYNIPWEISFGVDGKKKPVLSLETISEFFRRALPESFEECYGTDMNGAKENLDWEESEKKPTQIERDEFRNLDELEESLYRSIGCEDPKMERIYLTKKKENSKESVRIYCVTSPNLEFIYRLLEATHIDPRLAFFDDPKTLHLFKGTESIGVSDKQLGFSYGTLGVPIYGSLELDELLSHVKLNRFSDLVRLTGMFLGKGTWNENGDYLLREGIAKFYDLHTSRDGIFENLLQYDVPKQKAYDIVNSIWEGKGISMELERELEGYGVPDWSIESLKNLKTVYSRAQIIYQNGMAWQAAWYKTYYPREFYRVFFQVFATEEQRANIQKGHHYIDEILAELDPETSRDLGRPISMEYGIYLVAKEMYLRHYTL